MRTSGLPHHIPPCCSLNAAAREQFQERSLDRAHTTAVYGNSAHTERRPAAGRCCGDAVTGTADTTAPGSWRGPRLRAHRPLVPQCPQEPPRHAVLRTGGTRFRRGNHDLPRPAPAGAWRVPGSAACCHGAGNARTGRAVWFAPSALPDEQRSRWRGAVADSGYGGADRPAGRAYDRCPANRDAAATYAHDTARTSRRSGPRPAASTRNGCSTRFPGWAGSSPPGPSLGRALDAVCDGRHGPTCEPQPRATIGRGQNISSTHTRNRGYGPRWWGRTGSRGWGARHTRWHRATGDSIAAHSRRQGPPLARPAPHRPPLLGEGLSPRPTGGPLPWGVAGHNKEGPAYLCALPALAYRYFVKDGDRGAESSRRRGGRGACWSSGAG